METCGGWRGGGDGCSIVFGPAEWKVQGMEVVSEEGEHWKQLDGGYCWKRVGEGAYLGGDGSDGGNERSDESTLWDVEV